MLVSSFKNRVQSFCRPNQSVCGVNPVIKPLLYDTVSFSSKKELPSSDPYTIAQLIYARDIKGAKLGKLLEERFELDKGSKTPDIIAASLVGRFFAKKGNYEKALDIYGMAMRAVEDKPDKKKDKARIQAGIAEVFQFQQKPAEAIREYIRALRVLSSDTEYPKFHRAELTIKLADLLVDQESFDKAALLYKTALNDICKAFREEDRITDDVRTNFNTDKLAPFLDTTKETLMKLIYLYTECIEPTWDDAQFKVVLHNHFIAEPLRIQFAFARLNKMVSHYPAKDLIVEMRGWTK